MLKLGTLVQWTSPINGQDFRGIICGYPPGEDVYDVAHGGIIHLMNAADFTVLHGPCDEEIERLKTKLDKIRAALDEAQAVLSVLNADPTVAMFQIATHFQTMGNKVGCILQDELESDASRTGKRVIDPLSPPSFKEYLSDDVILAPITEEFLDAMCEERADGCGVDLSRAIQRWQSDELLIPQIARLIDESNWPLSKRLSQAHKAFMLDWEGDAYEGRHAPKPVTPRINWVHHVDFYHDGSVGIDRYGQEVRVYQVTETSKRRLENTINGLSWSWRPPTKLDVNFSTLKNRALAPMRHYK